MSELLDAAQVVIDMAMELGTVTDFNGRPYAIVPANSTLVDCEAMLGAPLDRRAEVRLDDVSSFAGYVNQFKDDHSRLFADHGAGRFTAWLDYHKTGPEGAARWGRHFAWYRPEYDDDWQQWRGHDGKAMGQIDFAEFIEDMLPTIIKPDGADVLEVAQNLEAKRGVTFKSTQRLADGTRAFTYEEEVQGQVGSGQIAIPETMVVKCPVYRWGDPIEINARLRYRISDKGLVLWYKLHRFEQTERAAFMALYDAIAKETVIKPHFGIAIDPAAGVEKIAVAVVDGRR